MAKTILLRSEVPVELTWDLSSIFAHDQAWEAAFAAVDHQLPELAALQGTLARSAPDLLHWLVRRDQIGELLDRVYEYATLHHHEDMAQPHYAAMSERAIGLATAYGTAISFYFPEIVAIEPDQLARFIADEPGLAAFRHELETITAQRPHVRSAEVEHVLAGVSELAHGPHQTFQALYNVDRQLPTIPDESGAAVPLTQGAYRTFLHSASRAVRRAAFDGMLGTFKNLEHTMAATLGSNVKKDVFFARARNYGSSLEAALGPRHIPTGVYHALIAAVHSNLPSLHRYLALRSRVLALGEPSHMYDLYAPLLPDVDLEIGYHDACNQVVKALAPLGEDYLAVVQKGIRSRWIDVLENRGKRAGAYSAGVYATPPFILLNYQSRRDDMFTLAHEMGHSVHSYLARRTQPYHYGNYGIFLAEIASTLNEALLRHYLLQRTTDRKQRASIVNQYLENFRQTLFRQTLFAEFDLEIHAMAEAGKALTADAFGTAYRALVERYYGAGGVVVDDLGCWEWAIIPHFYYDFYVFQYATGFAASAALTAKILAEGRPAVDRYLHVLQAGSSAYPIDLLKEAGIDMTTSASLDAAFAEFDRATGELETLIA